MTQITPPSYGLYWDGPVAWLIQGRGANNFVGLKATAPFRKPAGMCNHLIPSAAPIPDKFHWEAFFKILHDPLVQAMLPIPHEAGHNALFIEDPSDSLGLYLSTLSRLSSPIIPIVRPAWTFKAKDLEKELQASNVQPLVIVQANAKAQPLVDAIGRTASYVPRTTIISGNDEIVVTAPMQRIKTRIHEMPLADLMTLPLESIGAALLRRHARREALDAPMESRDERRNRQIAERSGG